GASVALVGGRDRHGRVVQEIHGAGRCRSDRRCVTGPARAFAVGRRVHVSLHARGTQGEPDGKGWSVVAWQNEEVAGAVRGGAERAAGRIQDDHFGVGEWAPGGGVHVDGAGEAEGGRATTFLV